MPNTTKCAHRACRCTAPHGENYCGPYCSNASDLTEVNCGCEHRGCVEQASSGADRTAEPIIGEA